MDTLFLINLSSPPLLFFLLGAAATLLRTDLEIPTQVAKFLSIYLLVAIGFKGGVALSESTASWDTVTGLGIALFMSVLVPFIAFFILKRHMSIVDAAATAATYGSVSAVTFVTATNYLDANQIDWNGYLVAAMALMESPAIIIGLLLVRFFSVPETQTTSGASSRDAGTEPDFDVRSLLREAFLNSSVFLILGSLLIGLISGPAGKAQISTFVDGMFTGVLCIFLLDMGMLATRRLKDMAGKNVLEGFGPMIFWAIVLPLISAAICSSLAYAMGIPEGDALLLVVLAASASYIAVPAAMRLALPEANPSVYLGMSLAITFPFNLLIGIPLYHQLLRFIL